jgi:hypothetical protein
MHARPGDATTQKRRLLFFIIVFGYYRPMPTQLLVELCFRSLLVHSMLGHHTADAPMAHVRGAMQVVHGKASARILCE